MLAPQGLELADLPVATALEGLDHVAVRTALALQHLDVVNELAPNGPNIVDKLLLHCHEARVLGPQRLDATAAGALLALQFLEGLGALDVPALQGLDVALKMPSDRLNTGSELALHALHNPGMLLSQRIQVLALPAFQHLDLMVVLSSLAPQRLDVPGVLAVGGRRGAVLAAQMALQGVQETPAARLALQVLNVSPEPGMH
mmetsp:Transcript_18438/g.55588  ORF Transcript_18438/g.55588 Transcript_18438/m.55588 type:complete len:201 (-) Transcript_18438:281-883(-)